MKLHLEGLEIRTDFGNPIGPRFIMGGRPPSIGFGPYKTKEEAEEARAEWEAYINERRQTRDWVRNKFRKKPRTP
jgi:hypothetical protein